MPPYTMYNSDREKLNDPLRVTQLETLINDLNAAKEELLRIQGFTIMLGKGYDNFHVKKVGAKFIYIDSGESGCFLVERATGELFNIKAYGVADYNKHKKAPLGNLATLALQKVDAQWLHAKRWNYLR